MKMIAENPLDTLDQLAFLSTHEPPQIVEWAGRRALRLNGLAVLPDVSLLQGSLEVQIGAQGACYPGLVFRLQDAANFELAYAQPHTSGKWDALQYDPVFNGSNTWQLFYGTGAQQTAQIPLGSWFRLRIDYQDDWACLRRDDQPPLIIPRLARAQQAGQIGLWSYLPAFYHSLRVWDAPQALPETPPEAPPEAPEQAPLVIEEWYLQGAGVVKVEPGGMLNLNRFLPLSHGEAHLWIDFELLEVADLEVRFGFSDELLLQIDGETIFHGINLFHDSPAWERRGYVSLDHSAIQILPPGRHRLEARLKASEPFGWGLIAGMQGAHYRLLPTA